MGKLSEIKPRRYEVPDLVGMDWQTVATAPFDSDLELAVIDYNGTHALVFPCRRVLRGWLNAKTGVSVQVHPTHWRKWDERVSGLSSRLAF
jgi:hypothetical protein